MTNNKKYFLNDFIYQNRKIYLSFKFINAVYGLDLEKENSEMFWSNQKCRNLCRHTRIFREENNIICIPRYATNIEICNVIDGTMKEVAIPQLSDGKGKFVDAIKVDGKIYCFPENYRGILEYDIKQMKYEIYQEGLNYNSNDGYCFISNAILENENIIIPYYCQNMLLEFNHITKKISNIQLPLTERKYIGFSKKDDTLCVLCDDMSVLVYQINEEKTEYIKMREWVREECIMGTSGIWHIDKKKGEINQFLFEKKEIISLNLPNDIEKLIYEGELLQYKSVEGILHVLLLHNRNLVVICFDTISQQFTIDKINLDNAMKKIISRQFTQGTNESVALTICDFVEYMRNN